jgi:sec-independent protein translocase protein TatA
MIQPIFLFIFDSPTQIIFVVAIIFLLFGSSKLPQLAKSIGQTQKAFKDGMREAEEDEYKEQQLKQSNPALVNAPAAPPISAMTDEEILAEMRRRAEAKQQ